MWPKKKIKAEADASAQAATLMQKLDSDARADAEQAMNTAIEAAIESRDHAAFARALKEGAPRLFPGCTPSLARKAWANHYKPRVREWLRRRGEIVEHPFIDAIDKQFPEA